MKYISTKYPIRKGKSWEGNIWTRQADGRYTCPQMPNLKLEQWQVDHDVRRGYLKLLKDGSV